MILRALTLSMIMTLCMIGFSANVFAQLFRCPLDTLLSKEQSTELLEVAFIGKVQLEKIANSFVQDSHKNIEVRTYKIIDVYQDPIGKAKNGSVIEVISYCRSIDHRQVGHVYEGVFEVKNDSYIKPDRSVRSKLGTLEKLRTKSLGTSLLQDVINQCSKVGGDWYKDESNKSEYCRFPTRDGDKVCSDSVECEEFCVALEENFTDEVKSKFSRKEELLGNSSNKENVAVTAEQVLADSRGENIQDAVNYKLKTQGRCTSWKKETKKYCGYVIENGSLNGSYVCLEKK